MGEDEITITLTGKTEFISVGSFLEVVQNSLGILRELDAAISGHSASVKWRISAASLNSPLAVTIFPDNPTDMGIGRDILNDYTKGLRQVEQDDKHVPSHFNEAALEYAKKLVSVLNDDITRIAFTTPWDKPVVPSQRVAANVDKLLPKEHDELGTFEGNLETLSVHGGTTFLIWDVVTGYRIECRFPSDMYEDAYAAFTKRVAVYGRIRFSRHGKPKYVVVEKLRQLRSQSELPQAKDLEKTPRSGEWVVRDID